MYTHIIFIQPLGLMYGSAGAFLSPENLVGRSGQKFPPDAATLAGLFASANKIRSWFTAEEIRHKLHVAGPFWSHQRYCDRIYVPIPRHKIFAEKNCDQWDISQGQWQRDESKRDLEADWQWFMLTNWDKPVEKILKNHRVCKQENRPLDQPLRHPPWEFTAILHPRLEQQQRTVVSEDGLFLENAVQMEPGYGLAYLSTLPMPDGCYKFGGEDHLVEVKSVPITQDSTLASLLRAPIKRAFALLCPAVWGSTRLSQRCPDHPDFPKVQQMLTDKAVPYRYSTGGRLGRGRYAVPAGSVYVLERPLNQCWWDWPEEWFPKEGFSLKQVGSGLCLPIDLAGLSATEPEPLTQGV